MKIGFIGLGAMGFPVAANIQAAGHELFLVCHRSREKAEELAGKGAVICREYKEMAEQVEAVFLCLPSHKEVGAILFEEGLAEGLKDGSYVVDLSTADLVASREYAARLKEKNIAFLDAPVSGGIKNAALGKLAVMVGGEQEAFEAMKPVLECFSATLVYCGGSGLGLAAKMGNNLIVAAEMAAISEALCLGVKAGLDTADLYEVLKGGTANSFILNSKLPAIMADDYSAKFRLRLMLKDLGIITSAAEKLGVPAPMAEKAKELYEACAENHGDEDSAAVARYYQEKTGLSFKSGKV